MMGVCGMDEHSTGDSSMHATYVDNAVLSELVQEALGDLSEA